MGDADIQGALREMAGQIGALGGTVRSLEATWRQQEASASQGRRDLHQKFETLRTEVHTMSTQVAGALNDIAFLKPIVNQVETAKQRAIGAGMLGKALWAVGGAMVAGGVWLLSHIK